MTPEALARVHKAAFVQTRAWSAQEFAALLGTSGVILAGDARSFIIGRVTLDEAEILTVATDPAFQRQGLAKAGLTSFEAQAQDSHATRIFLEVAADNFAAISLYQNVNYAPIGRRKGYYVRTDGTRTDAIVMEKQLR